jgi:hypothetical protein
MLKKKTCLAIVTFSLFVSGIMLSCNDSPTGTSVSSDNLIGKWIVDKMHVKGTMSILGQNVSMDTTTVMKNDLSYVQFYSNNTYKAVLPDYESSIASGFEKRKILSKITQVGAADTGTWSLSGNTLSLKSTTNDTTLTMQDVAINGNSLNMKMPVKASSEGFSVDIVETFYLSKK